MAFFWVLGCSSLSPGVLGAELDDAHDGSWRRCFVVWLYLVAKPVYVGVDVDGLAYPLHRPMTYNRQTRGQVLLPGVVLSRHYSGWWCLSGGCEALGLVYLVEY
jgi:lipid-binding SYLF domain-containing protein